MLAIKLACLLKPRIIIIIASLNDFIKRCDIAIKNNYSPLFMAIMIERIKWFVSSRCIGRPMDSMWDLPCSWITYSCPWLERFHFVNVLVQSFIHPIEMLDKALVC